MRKAQTEEFAAWRRKKRNCKPESKGKPKEATTTKPCSERSMNKDRKKEEKLWSVKNKP